MRKPKNNTPLKEQLIGLSGTPKATIQGGSGHSSAALMKNYASPKDPSLFDGKEITERELRIREEIQNVGLERRGKPIFLTPTDSKLSILLSTCLNDNDTDIAEFIRWTERAEEFGLKQAGKAPNPIARTFSLRDLAKKMYNGRAKKQEIQQVRDALKRLREIEQVMTLGKQGVKVTSSLIMREYAVEDMTPEERGLDEERIVFGTIFLWNLKKRFAYVSPKAFEIWGRRGSGTENQLFAILFSTLHSLCFNHQLAAIKARKNLRNEINSDHKDETKEAKSRLYDEQVEERVIEALTHRESVAYLKSRIPSDYDSTKQYRSKFNKDFQAAVEALKEIGIITHGTIQKGKGRKGQDIAIFRFSETYKEEKALPEAPSEDEE